MYESGALKSMDAGIPVISVGNLTLGGSGKTPFVMEIMAQAREMGLRLGLVTRGYGRKGKYPVILPNGSPDLKVEQIGDEAAMILCKSPKAAVAIGKKKSLAARDLAKTRVVDALVIDDGFQHLALRRDLDVVLFDCSVANVHDRVFPAGALREGMCALKRADVIVLTKWNLTSHGSNLEKIVKDNAPGKTLLRTDMTASGVICLNKDGMTENIDSLKGKNVVSVCGIGNPDSFGRTLRDLEMRIVGEFVYRDHHWYEQRDVTRIEKACRELNADCIMTTEKDAVKLRPLISAKAPWHALEIGIRFHGEGREVFKKELARVIGARFREPEAGKAVFST